MQETPHVIVKTTGKAGFLDGLTGEKKHRTLSGVFSVSVQSFVCVPSQKGALSVCLHRQSSAGPLFTAVNGIPPAWVVPKWDWSQNG